MAYEGGAHILISLAAVLQIVAFGLQCAYYRPNPNGTPRICQECLAPPAPSALPAAPAMDKAADAKMEEAVNESKKRPESDYFSARPVSFLPAYSSVVAGNDVKAPEDVKKVDPDRKSASFSIV
jgi:hypothetical protein